MTPGMAPGMPSRRRALALLAGSLTLGGCQRSGGLTVGFMAPLSGRRTDLGEGGRNGALVAVERINALGGVAGRPLQLLVEDDQMDPQRAVAGFQRMLARGIVALVGAYAKPLSDAIGPMARAVDVPVISPNLALPVDAEHDDIVLRLNRTAQQNAQAYARQLTRSGQRRIAVIAEVSSREFVQSWIANFSQALSVLGSQTSQVLTYTADADTSFDALVRSTQGTACDGAMLIGPTTDVARLCQQFRRLRPGLPLCTIDRAGNAALLQLGGRAVEDLVLLQAFNPDDRSAAYLAFAQRFHERFGEAPGQGAVLAHDAMAVLAQAMQRQPRGRALADTLGRGEAFQGLQQPIRFDAQGGAQRQAFFVQVRHGRFATLGAA